ncbi:hypothetical protein ACVW0J_002775 [Bradyrhizobium sp. i1.7.7]
MIFVKARALQVVLCFSVPIRGSKKNKVEFFLRLQRRIDVTVARFCALGIT